jgi:hypothetical protein
MIVLEYLSKLGESVGTKDCDIQGQTESPRNPLDVLL